MENSVIQLVVDAASRTRDLTGDGAKTVILLAHSMLRQATAAIMKGADGVLINRGIETAVAAICGAVDKNGNRSKGYLDSLSKPVSGGMIAQIGTISSKDEITGRIIAEAMKKVGRDGVITVEESVAMHSSLNVVEGIRFDKGYLSPDCITDIDRTAAVLDYAYILINEGDLLSIKDVLPLVEQIAKSGRPLLLVAAKVALDVVAALAPGKLSGILQVCPVESGFGVRGEGLRRDIAVLTGAKVITDGLSSVQLHDLGRATKVIVGKDSTTIVDGKGRVSEIEKRVKEIRRAIEICYYEIPGTSGDTSDYLFEELSRLAASRPPTYLEEELARLVGGIAFIAIGGATEAEMKSTKAAAESAMRAVLAALDEGILPGGGTALLRAGLMLDNLNSSGDEQMGIKIVRDACDEILMQLCSNSGQSAREIIAKILTEENFVYGFNADEESCGDLVKAGVIEPVRTPRSALQNAATLVQQLLSTKSLISGAY